MSEGFYLARELKNEEAKLARMARIEELENEVFERSVGIVNACLAFAEIDPKQVDPPQAWIDEYGEDAARKRLEVAKSQWLPASVAPNGAKLAMQAMTGISRGRSWRVKITQQNLNVKIALPAPTTNAHPGPVTYEVRDLET